MGAANRKMDAIVRAHWKKHPNLTTVRGLIELVSSDLKRPIHESTIYNSLRRLDLEVSDEPVE